MTYNEIYNKWNTRFITGDAPLELIRDLEQLQTDNLVIFKEDLICDKGKMTFVSNGDVYKVKVKKVINDQFI